MIWGYQLPALRAAGFRVIAYSRRGFGKSGAVDKGHPGIASDELRALADVLKLDRFSIVASAAGCSPALDFALTQPDRVQAVVFSAGVFYALNDGEHGEALKSLAAYDFEKMPAAFRELGPSYRAVNPAGEKAWIDLERSAVTGNSAGARNSVAPTASNVGALKMPVMFIAGQSDLYAPPSSVQLVANYLLQSDFVVMEESGHSPHWEQPESFNRVVIEFLKRERH